MPKEKKTKEDHDEEIKRQERLMAEHGLQKLKSLGFESVEEVRELIRTSKGY